MIVADLLPTPEQHPIGQVLDRLDGAPRPTPFDPAALALLGDLSRRILAALPRQADAVTLGYWLRPAHLQAIAARHPAPADGSLRVPAGLAFHIPPSNVDGMFIYSWAAGLLAGNRQVVRLSRRRGAVADKLLALVGDALAASPLGAASAFVEYDRDDAVTAAISARCDLRVVWGGDATIAAIRVVPLSPHAREIAFADRLSLTVMDAEAVLDLDEAGLASLAQRLFNDVLTFDQMACSSPRRLVWRGSADAADRADARLTRAMRAEIAHRGYRIPDAVALEKYAAACRTAVRAPVRGIEAARTDWVTIDLGHGPVVPPANPHPGGGLLYRSRVDRLAELVPAIDRSVQTLSHFGISAADLADFARALGGRGIDRMVPLGQALAFDLVWDGQDLIDAFTRRVTIWP
jgi:hypothetical protein